jgi:hypothetical protein
MASAFDPQDFHGRLAERRNREADLDEPLERAAQPRLDAVGYEVDWNEQCTDGSSPNGRRSIVICLPCSNQRRCMKRVSR